LDFRDAIQRFGDEVVHQRYGNLFDMYQSITGEDPYKVPMRIYPAPHYTMGGLWVDYNLMSTIPGLFICGEANFSDHGANRLGASALMQGLADGYFILPYTLGHYFASKKLEAVSDSTPAFQEAAAAATALTDRFLGIRGKRPVDEFHRRLGIIMWDHCGMARSDQGLRDAIGKIAALREEFWNDVSVPGSGNDLNASLEKAGRVADFFDLADLMCRDALHRKESCGGHFREEYQTAEGEAKRNDAEYCYAAVWEYGNGSEPKLHKEPLEFENIKLQERSYK